jgi:hypothetical protein
MLANGKVARQLASKAFNPNYNFTKSVENFSVGEMAAPILTLGDIPSGTVNRSFAIYLFGKLQNLSLY